MKLPCIGLIGHGMVGSAVHKAFIDKICVVVSDPAYNNKTIADVVKEQPIAIFVCVPTPTDDTNYAILTGVLDELVDLGYAGLIVVKSTVPAKYIEPYDVIYNPEFLSRATAFNDFINPPFVLLGGDFDKAQQLADVYRGYSKVNMDCVKFTDIETAVLAKYTMNCFYALKVTYMNAIYDVANQVGADYQALTDILQSQPWMGTHHFQVPGPDGSRGFGGPCLPKDTESMVKEFDISILREVLKLNKEYRNDND